MLTVAVLSSVSGYAYEPLVQEGLIWQKTHEEYEDNVGPHEVVNIQRFGAPVELYGRTYHPIMYDDRECGYMRQDGDKVYLLVDGKNISYIWYYNENGDRFELSPGDEVLIYDFGAKEGDKYMTVYMDEYSQLYVEPQMIEIHVVKADTVMVNGHERRRLYLSPFGDWEFRDEYIAVEGVGFNIGAVHLPQYALLAGHYPYTSILRFDSMTDAEGNVLFTGADFDARAYQPVVQEGKAWSQISYASPEDRGASKKLWLPEMYFEGKCERNGKEYSVLRTSPDNVLALMRQEGGKVYLLLDEEFISKHNFNDRESTDSFKDDDKYRLKDTEVLVYDLDAPKGSSYKATAFMCEFNMVILNHDVYVWDVDEINVNGEVARRQHWIDLTIVEGFGPSSGMCLIPQSFLYETGSESSVSPELKMHHIIDRATREEIFTYEDFSKPSVGVEEIPAEQPSDGVQAKPKDNKMYDLNGREIRNPLPGTVYILNGEKHVAK